MDQFDLEAGALALQYAFQAGQGVLEGGNAADIPSRPTQQFCKAESMPVRNALLANR